MQGRRPVAVALVAAALTVVALSAGLQLAPGQARHATSGGEPALTARATGLDAAVVRMNPEERRDLVASQRTLKHRIVLLAIVAAILGLPGVARRRATVGARGRQRLVAWLAVHGSRSPPHFQLLAP